MSISKITPILVVESVELNLPFWRDQLGYKVVHSVPHEKEMGFVILNLDESEVMLQSVSSLKEDLKFSEVKAGDVLLYADVKSLDETVAASKDGKILISKRTTDYGATEAWMKTPSGTVLGFAEFKKLQSK
jgi:hypothetical protein